MEQQGLVWGGQVWRPDPALSRVSSPTPPTPTLLLVGTLTRLFRTKFPVLPSFFFTHSVYMKAPKFFYTTVWFGWWLVGRERRKDTPRGTMPCRVHSSSGGTSLSPLRISYIYLFICHSCVYPWWSYGLWYVVEVGWGVILIHRKHQKKKNFD